MNKNQNEIPVFRQFAEDRLKEHFAELNTSYQNRAAGSEELEQQAYKEHREIFNRELDEEIETLNKENNPWLKGELENLKRTYVIRLALDKF